MSVWPQLQRPKVYPIRAKDRRNEAHGSHIRNKMLKGGGGADEVQDMKLTGTFLSVSTRESLLCLKNT